jgi:hypothetical protein
MSFTRSMSAAYWCHSWQCVADWTWGSNANNLATALGAIATFVAAYLALRFSQLEARRRRADDLMRAKLCLIALTFCSYSGS